MENGKENIIRRIAEDTEKRAAEIALSGRTAADEIIGEANAAVSAERAKAEAKLKADAEEYSRRAAVRAEMDGKKYLLDQKQKMMSSVYAEAKKRIASLPREKYLALMEKLMGKYAEKGEEVIICKKDADIITDKIAAKFGCRLANHYGNFEGGFILSGYGYEKNVTLDVVIAEAKLITETQVARILFDGE